MARSSSKGLAAPHSSASLRADRARPGKRSATGAASTCTSQTGHPDTLDHGADESEVASDWTGAYYADAAAFRWGELPSGDIEPVGISRNARDCPV